MKATHWKHLTDRNERTVARIATMAINNTVFGGASAMVKSKRLFAMGGQDVRHVVSDVYSSSTGRSHSEHSAWECPECGGANLGITAAIKCCGESF